jgi:hypothetical protein
VEQYSESEHVSKLGERLGDADFRDLFVSDPSQALSDADIDEQAVPKNVVDALRRCQPEELAALANVRNALIDAGVEERYMSKIV